MGEFVIFVPGINQTRAENQFKNANIEYYNRFCFEVDSHIEGDYISEAYPNRFNNSVSLNVGDIIINNSLQLATMVSEENSGKVPSLNFTKIKFKNNELDKLYFLYLFNNDSYVKCQKNRELQGNGLVMRIPVKSLNRIIIPYIDIESQKKIGRAYYETMILKNKLKKYTGLIEKYLLLLIKENLREEK